MKQIVEVVENQEVNSEVSHKKYILYSAFLERMVNLELIANEGTKQNEKSGLLLLNDGQDLRKLGLSATLKRLSRSDSIIPITLVAITAGERKSEYGVSGEPDYLGRGGRAEHYRNFIIFELLPWIHSKLGTYIPPELTAFAGCSLGGLSALDIVSSNPGHFGMAGVFSGSLWWRRKGYDDGYTDNDRIILSKLRQLDFKKHFRCWLMAGTNDEINDRNYSGVIDAVEDTLDVFELLSKKMHSPSSHLSLRIVNGGYHDAATWSHHFPDFIHTTFGKHSLESR